MRKSITDNPEETVLGVGEMQKELELHKQTISELNIPNGMEAYDAAVFTDQYDTQKFNLRLRVSAIHTIQERIRTRCLNYASRVEKQIMVQNKPNEFLSDVQNLVNNYFATNSEETYRKLQKLLVWLILIILKTLLFFLLL